MLTGSFNILAEVPPENGADGLDGCILRTTEWAVGKNYLNESESKKDGIRFWDRVAVVSADRHSAKFYVCNVSHVSTLANKPPSSYWTEIKQSEPIDTPLIIANTAVFKMTQTNKIFVMDDRPGEEGLSCLVLGGGEFPIMLGSVEQGPKFCCFKVDKDGKLFATEADIKGKITATSGEFTGTVHATGGEFTGKVTATSGEFTGTVHATGGEFTGKVTATSGEFKGTVKAERGYFSGFVYKGTSILTISNIDKYVKVIPGFPEGVLDFNKLTHNIYFRGKFGDKQIPVCYLPGRYGDASQLSQNQLNEANAYVGCDIYLCNFSDDATVGVSGQVKVDGSPVGVVIKPGVSAHFHCVRKFSKPNDVVYDEVWWDCVMI